MATERLQVILELVTGQYKREAREAASATGRIGDQAASAGSATGRLGGRFTALAATAKVALAGAAVGAVTAFASKGIEAAKNLGESVNAVNQIFGDAADRIHSFGQVSAQVVGLSTREFNELAVNTGAMLTNMGFGFDAAANESVRLTRRAADMASVFNTDVSEALNAINAGLRGETEPLRRFGVSLSDARIRAKAVELGLADTTAAVDEHGKTVAALELIYQDTAKTQGDFIRTSDDLANSQRILAAEAENASARFGEALIPVKTFGTNVATSFLRGIQVMGLFGSEARQVALASITMEEALNNVIGRVKMGDDAFGALAFGLGHAARNGDVTAETLEVLAAAAGVGVDQFADFAAWLDVWGASVGLSAEQIADLKGKLDEAGAAGSDAAPGIGEAADAAGEVADKARDGADAVRDLTAAWKEQTDPVFAAIDQLGRLREAQDKVNQMIADGETDTDEFRQAQVDLVSQTIDTQAALDGLDTTNIEESVRLFADVLNTSDDNARDLLESLGLLDGKEVTTVINVEERFRVVGGGFSRSGLRERAHGGFMPAGEPTLVGERRPEVVVPARDSFAFPSLEAFNRAMGGGGYSPTINVTAPESAGVMEQVRLALSFDRLAR